MTPTWFFLACQMAVIAYALVSGVFMTFSDFVMRSLGGAKTAAGVEVMQVINRKVYRSIFMVLLLGMSAISPIFIGYAYVQLTGAAAILLITGGAIYLAGVFVVSLLFNVPMNQKLESFDHVGSDAATYWQKTYLTRWVFWNHVRTLASGAAAVCFLAACGVLAQGTAGG